MGAGPPEAFVDSDGNVPGGPERRDVLELSHVVHLDAGLPPGGAVGGLEALCNTSRHVSETNAVHEGHLGPPSLTVLLHKDPR